MQDSHSSTPPWKHGSRRFQGNDRSLRQSERSIMSTAFGMKEWTNDTKYAVFLLVPLAIKGAGNGRIILSDNYLSEHDERPPR